MTVRPNRRTALVMCALAGSLAAPLPARAQFAPPNAAPGTGDIATGRRVTSATANEPAQQKAPDAIPGARAREPVAPSTRAAGDMQPTDALFDAINRGDIAAARDALNRGADLNGTNILGMTPMELSVDLGRNDISFLLLSMRGEGNSSGTARSAGREAPVLPAIKPGTTKVAAKTGAAPKPDKVALIPVAPKPYAAPKLFANDGGTPLPNAGFLGFDSRSASN